MARDMALTGRERMLDRDEIIVSKTDLKGRITYANDVFWRISGYAEKELIGTPHSILRHPEMPRCVFKRMWDTIQGGHEIFAYVNNRCKNGDHYWVLAHVTPSRDTQGRIVGYHSNRRSIDRRLIDTVIVPLYRDLQAEEERHTNRKEGMLAGERMLNDLLAKKGMPYDQFIATLG